MGKFHNYLLKCCAEEDLYVTWTIRQLFTLNDFKLLSVRVVSSLKKIDTERFFCVYVTPQTDDMFCSPL